MAFTEDFHGLVNRVKSINLCSRTLLTLHRFFCGGLFDGIGMGEQIGGLKALCARADKTWKLL